tara:strand:- start:92 stop:352 length:261 start_codon:yes stop_codon:yes gene_type:complete
MNDKKLQTLSLIPIGSIVFFYLIYLFKWEPIIVGVFKELLLLPSILIQLLMTLYFSFNLITKQINFSFLIFINIIFSVLILISFIK